MHELSVCQSLIAEVVRVAAQNDASAVTAITVAIGPLSGVQASLLLRAFKVARAGTIVKEAHLNIETMPVIVWCAACATQTTTAANALVCGRCGTWRVDLESGNELLLKTVELAVAATPVAAQ